MIFYAPVSASGYTQMLKAAYTAIKAANPDAVVLAGSLGATTDVNGVSVTPQRFLADMYAAGAAGYFDALSYHPYHFTLPFSAGAGTTNAPLDQVRRLYELMVANGDGDKKIWATEYGTATTPGWGVTQTEQAAMLRDFLTAWSKLPYAGPAFVFTSQDAQTGILNHEYNFGLFTSGGKPKLAAQALAELIAAAGLGELPDYTAPRMSAARDMYLQLASVGFGLANMALIIPNAAIAVIYNVMPGPLRRAFTAVANAVSEVVARVAIAVTPVMEAALGVVVRALPPTPNRDADDTADETDEQTTGLAAATSIDSTGVAEATDPATAAVGVVDDTDVEPASVTVGGVAAQETGQVPAVAPAVAEESLTEPLTETEPVTEPVEESKPETELVDTGDTETGSVGAPASASDAATETVTETAPAAPTHEEQAQREDTAADKAENTPRRGPRTAAVPSGERHTSPAADRDDRGTSDRSTSTGSPASGSDRGTASSPREETSRTAKDSGAES